MCSQQKKKIKREQQSVLAVLFIQLVFHCVPFLLFDSGDCVGSLYKQLKELFKSCEQIKFNALRIFMEMRAMQSNHVCFCMPFLQYAKYFCTFSYQVGKQNIVNF